MYISAAAVISAAAGALIFARGFLLVRVEIVGSNTCGDGASFVPSSSASAGRCDPLSARSSFSSFSLGSECWTEPLFARTIILVVDALRWDFAAPGECWGALGPGGSPHSGAHCGAMPLVTSLLSTRPAHASLVLATADPPTVTMQRIKAITTGGLPTFIDASANFAMTGAAVREDSWVSQLSRAAAVHNLSGAAFWGDDTWLALFPKNMSIGGAPWAHGASPQGSFDTRDLDGADARSGAGLLKALHSRPLPQWRVGVLHTLGVDHAGHSFGADSSQMRKKLADADALISDLAKALEAAAVIDGAPALLIVLGDHGMTEDGNHGGAARDEAAAALMAFSFGRPLLRVRPTESLAEKSPPPPQWRSWTWYPRFHSRWAYPFPLHRLARC